MDFLPPSGMAKSLARNEAVAAAEWGEAEEGEVEEAEPTGVVPTVPYHLQTKLTATRGSMQASRVLFGAADPSLVAEYVYGLVTPDVLAASYGMTLEELQQVVSHPAFVKAADDLNARWKADPTMDTKARAKVAFDHMLPAMVGTAMQPGANPSLAYKTFELMAKIANVIPREQVEGGGSGGNPFSINIVLQTERQDVPMRVISGDDE